MRTTINLDDELLAEAQEMAGPMEKTALVNEALRALIEREASLRLAMLGGAAPDMEHIPRGVEDEPCRPPAPEAIARPINSVQTTARARRPAPVGASKRSSRKAFSR
jgi:hypothetical protein